LLKSLLVWTLLIGAASAADYPVSGTITAEINIFDSKYLSEAAIIGRTTPDAAVQVFECFDLLCRIDQGWVDARNILLSNGLTGREYLASLRPVFADTQLNLPADVVVWGDSLSNSALGDLLAQLLPGRLISMQGVPGQTGREIAERMLADTRYTGRLKVIWDRHYTGENPDTYLADLKPMIDRAAATGDFIIVSDIRQLVPSNIIDPVKDKAIAERINRELARLYPNNFLDVSALLDDPAMRIEDGLHLSPAGNAAVAKALARAIMARD